MAIIPALLPVLADSGVLGGAVGSVTLAVPNGADYLWLEHQNVGCSDNDLRNLQLTAVSGNGGYDWSRQLYNAATSTNNAGNFLVIGNGGDADGVIQVTSGWTFITNRAGQEKVFIGRETYFDNSAEGAADETLGAHTAAKDRDTSNPITSLVVAFAAGNITAGSRLILRGLSLSGAPHPGTPDIVQLLHDKVLAGTSASEIFAGLAGYEELLLLWSNVTGDSNSVQRLDLQMNGDTGAHYDWSNQGISATSSTINAQTEIRLASFGDQNGSIRINSGFATISNRKGQDKRVIGIEADTNTGGANDNDTTTRHDEATWRNKEDEISSLIISASAENMGAVTRFTILGLSLKGA